MKKLYFALVALLLFAFPLSAISCGPASQEETEIKVGSVMSVSGIFASLGDVEKKGLELAIEEINKSGGIAGKQIKKIPKKKKELNYMMTLVDEAINILNSKNMQLNDFGKLLHEQWKVKKTMTHLISNSRIDEIYDMGRKAGAIGGKLLGAGGGGFMIFFAKPEYQKKIKERLRNLIHVPFTFESLGSQIIYYAPGTNF